MKPPIPTLLAAAALGSLGLGTAWALSRAGAPLPASLNAPGAARGAGPDVIVGDLYDPIRWGSAGGYTAYSVGTVSCNIGDQPLDWIANTPAHPVIAQNLFRIKDGRITHIGQSWLKHGFTALNQSLCSTCNPSPSNSLGVGCSDPYDAFLNGFQPDLGPKSDVNAATGDFPYPPTLNGTITDSTSKRLRVKNEDVDPALNAGAVYVVEGQYVTADDAQAGNKNNNASYRQALISGGSFNMSLTGSTVRESPAIYAWQVVQPTVTIEVVDVPNDGRLIVAYDVTDNGDGTWHYEYAVYNQTSDRGVRAFGLPGSWTQASNPFFQRPENHSGERWVNNNWQTGERSGFFGWGTQSFNQNQNASAIRWGQLYNFAFDSANAPVATDAVLLLFKPGTGGDQIFVPVLGPN